MAGLSDSFTKLVMKIGENVGTRKNNLSAENTTTTPQCPIPPQRPGSPFIMLEGDQEIQYDHTNSANESFESTIDVLDSVKKDDVSVTDYESFDYGQSDDFSKPSLFNVYQSEDEIDSSDDDEAAMLEKDEMRSHRGDPLTKEQFESYFDECGRLVNEHDLRKQIFKGGVDETIRRDVWTFLFELYPFNSTNREREVLKVENKVCYEAMKIRWKNILKNLIIDSEYEGVRYCPKWYKSCTKDSIKSASPVVMDDESNFTLDDQTSIDNDESTSGNDDNGSQKNTADRSKTIDEISIALADAMQELDVDHKQLSRHTSDLSDISFVERPINSPDHLDVGEEIPEDERFDNKVFPNPFMLSPEYVNTHDSLFSQSENIETVDIDCLDSRINTKLLTNQNGAHHSDLTCFSEKNSDDVNVNETNDILELEKVSLNCDNHELTEIVTESSKNSFHYDTNEASDRITEIRKNSFCYENNELSNGNAEARKNSFCRDNEESSDIFNESHKESVNCDSYDPTEIITEARKNSFHCDDNEPSDSITTINTISFHCDDNDSTMDKNMSISNGFLTEISQKDKNTSHELEISCFDAQNGVAISVENESEFEIDNDFKLEKISYMNDYDAIENNKNFLNVSNAPTDPVTISRNKINSSSFARMDCGHDKEPISTKYEKPFVAKSPTGESLEKLPPWIAQMIRASTPTTPNKTKRKVEVELDECYCKQTSEEIELNKERKELNKELLGIVENAHKYVEENMKLHSGTNTPIPRSKNSSPVLEIDSREEDVVTPTESDVYDGGFQHANDSLFLSPMTQPEADVFLHHTPSLKLVTDTSPDSTWIDENEPSRPCPYCSYEPETSNKIVLPSSLGEDQLKFMEIQAQLFAARQPFGEKRIAESVRVIDKDVPRTDREIDMFQGNSSPGLLRLRDALLTYAFFHPEVGYAQGMNDIMARFLYVMNDEAEAYWMFRRYMEHFKNDFMEEGMLKKIAQVEQLLMKMDRELYDFLLGTDMGLIFCHRWLLLNFKREFEYNEAVRLFEITSSRHLEVSSLSAEIERSKERAKEFVKDKAGSHMEEVFLLPEYPFDVFVCVAMLMECRELIMGTLDISMVYQILSNLPKTLELQQVLRRSEELFYRYCRKTTVDCFQVIDDLEIPDQKRSRLSFPFSFR